MWVELVSKVLLGHYKHVLGVLVSVVLCICIFLSLMFLNFCLVMFKEFWEISKVLLGGYYGILCGLVCYYA